MKRSRRLETLTFLAGPRRIDRCVFQAKLTFGVDIGRKIRLFGKIGCRKIERDLGFKQPRSVLSSVLLPRTNPMIQVEHLSKLYEDYLAVDEISFELHDGWICGLVGPNGAGKTTTMRCLAGLLPATTGKLRVAGCDLSRELIDLKRKLAYVPDDPPLFDDLTVGQHMDFVGRIYNVADHIEKSKELLEHFELTDKIHAGATTLSRGMRQKLAICCAYLYDPQVLLLDEPLTGLDPPGIRKLLNSVVQRAAMGTTVIISSHLLAMIEEVCTHLMVMKQGRLQYFGAADDLRAKFPAAKTLEEAFFAATCGQSSDELESNMPLIPATIPIHSLDGVNA